MPHPDHEKNRYSWNQVVELHYNHLGYRTKEFLDGTSHLKRIELEALGDVAGKSMLHLLCHFGLDSLSWVRKGAEVTGIDISEKAIEFANKLKGETKLEAEFIRSDVLDLIGVIDKKFDIVFQSYGTHIWISDIERWAEVVSHYLKPGGTFFIVDSHPVEVLFNAPTWDYFTRDPERTVNPADYIDRDFKGNGEYVEWQHPLSEILNALISAGLTIEHVGEYNLGYYQVDENWYSDKDGYWYPSGGPTSYPLLLSIKARKM